MAAFLAPSFQKLPVPLSWFTLLFNYCSSLWVCFLSCFFTSFTLVFPPWNVLESAQHTSPSPSLPVSSLLSTHCPDSVLHHEKMTNPTGRHILLEVEEAGSQILPCGRHGGWSDCCKHSLFGGLCLFMKNAQSEQPRRCPRLEGSSQFHTSRS